MSGDTEFPAPDRGTLIAAIAVVAATWFFFLIFNQRAVVGLAADWITPDAWREQGLLTCLAAGGVLGSLLAAWRFNVFHWRGQLSWSLRAGAVAAALATIARTWEALAVFAALGGVALGWVTVTLVTGLRPSIGTTKLGWVIGFGTGIGYAAANLPFVFEATPERQAVLAAVVIAAVSVLAPFLTPQEPSVSNEPVYGVRGMMGWVCLLAPLVALDAALFYEIQNDDALRTELWSGTGTLLAIGAVHLGSGWLAGWALDGGWRWRVWLIGAMAIAIAALLVRYEPMVGVSMEHAVGVSAYAATLLYVLARGGRAWTAALVLILVGWVGTAVGVGVVWQSERVAASLLPWLGGGGVVGSALLAWANRQPLKVSPGTGSAG